MANLQGTNLKLDCSKHCLAKSLRHGAADVVDGSVLHMK
jgi:hypothetical protein